MPIAPPALLVNAAMGMPYMNSDGTVHEVLPSADQLAHPTFRGPAVVQLAASAAGAGLAILGRPRAAIVLSSAAMIPYGIAVLVHRGRTWRGLKGGDEGALAAGTVAQLLGPALALLADGGGMTVGASMILAGAAMLGATAQGLLARPAERAARSAGAALLLASVAFGLSLVSLAGSRGAVLALSLVATCAALAVGALSLSSNQMGTLRSAGARGVAAARPEVHVAT